MKALLVLLLISYTAVTLYSEEARISCPDTIHIRNCSRCDATELVCPHLSVEVSTSVLQVIVSCNEAFKEFPNLNIGNISQGSLLVEDCIPSENESLMETMRFLGVNSIKALEYHNMEIIPYTAVFFEGLSDLEFLTLSINFEQVKLDAFSNLLRLQELTIFGNPILQIGIFDSLAELSEIAIFYEETTKLQPGIFRNQRKLEALVLGYRRLNGLTQNIFQDIQNLKFLDLSDNGIELLPNDIFGLLKNLTTLKLNMNQFSSISLNLTENPKLETFELARNRNYLPLSNYFLSDLPELKEVKLYRSQLHYLPETLFHGSRAIIKLYLSHNGLKEIPELLLQDQWNLEYLDLGDNYLSTLPNQFFTATKKLKILRLSGNRLESLSGHVFATLRKLKELDLANNKLHYIDYYDILQGTKSLKKLFLQHNELEGVPDWKDDSTSLHSTDSVNTFSQFRKMPLQQLDLSNNNITNLSSFHFNFYSKAINVDLSHNKISSIYINNMDTDMAHVVVNLTSNPLNCNCHMLDFVQYVMAKNESHINFFVDGLHCWIPIKLHGIPVRNLQNQDLTCPLTMKNSFKCPPECSCNIRPIDLTIIVNCSGQGITKVQPLPQPSAINYTFIELHIENNCIEQLPTSNEPNYEHVRELHARNNCIETLSVRNLPTRLQLLDLTYNKLVTMDKPILDTFNSSVSLKSVYLSNNPWICECTNQDFINFVQQNRLKLSADKSPIICADGTTVVSINVGVLCGENTGLVVLLSVTLGCSGLVIGLLFAIYYYYKTEIKVWLFTHNLLLCLVTEEELDKDKEYDAFISYCHKDAQFIEDVLVPRMETEMNFKICVHERDWIPGETIPDQIISSVENSRRTIIVLSKHYLESSWAQMEFQAAYLKSQAERRVRIIIIIFGEIGDVNSLGLELETYLKMNTYLKYDDRWFWDKLRYAMPHPVSVAEVKKQKDRSGE